MGSDPALYRNKNLMSAPAENCAAVVASDSADLTFYSRGLYVGVAGNVSVTLVGTEPVGAAGVVFKGVPAGTTLPIRVRRVWSTGTTATDIVAIW